MSDLARSFAKTKLSSMPPPLESPSGEEDPNDSSSASSMSSTGTVLPPPTQQLTSTPKTNWSDYFAQELHLDWQDPDSAAHAQYHVYLTPAPPNKQNASLIVLHHGAGSSGLSFALFARSLRKLLPDVAIVSVEARDHGSVAYDESDSVARDLWLAILATDLERTLDLLRQKQGWAKLPSTVLVGHSLGGAVVTDVAARGTLGSALVGYAVLDVVEGSAMDALKSMQAYLASRPRRFYSLDEAVQWHVRSRTLRNLDSAWASVPSLLRRDGDFWVWQTELERTESYWEDWFGGMSGKFLRGKGAKLLILAGTDRLDKELMIGQMQGKFQLQVFPSAGHFVQEDLPERTAEVVAEFYKRNDRSTLVLPPKVSDMIAQGKKV